jgi:uncharacterized protein (DUF58 family)
VILPSRLALRVAGGLALGSLVGVVDPRLGWICVGALVALGVGVLVEGWTLPRNPLAVRRRVPGRLSVTEPEPLAEVLVSRASVPLEARLRLSAPPDVTLEPVSATTVVLPPRGAVEVRFRLRAARRGERCLPRSVVRFGRPRGLAVRQAPLGVETTLAVSPNVARLRRYETLRPTRALASLGQHRTRYSGLGAEFDHLRAYSQGDDHRRIHWKATARHGFPVTQIVRTERGQSVLVAVDVSHWMGVSAGALSRLDHAVDAALFLSHVAQKAGDQVGLLLFANEVFSFLPPSARPGQTRRILDALAVVQARPVHPSYRNLTRYLLTRRLRRSLIVIISEPPDAESAREMSTALAALRSRHVPLAVGLKDQALASALAAVPTDVFGLCRRLAARELEEERAQRLRGQGEKGLKTLDVLPQQLSVAVVNRYLELKGRGVV